MIIYMEPTLALMSKSDPKKVQELMTTGEIKKLDDVRYIKTI